MPSACAGLVDEHGKTIEQPIRSHDWPFMPAYGTRRSSCSSARSLRGLDGSWHQNILTDAVASSGGGEGPRQGDHDPLVVQFGLNIPSSSSSYRRPGSAGVAGQWWCRMASLDSAAAVPSRWATVRQPVATVDCLFLVHPRLMNFQPLMPFTTAPSFLFALTLSVAWRAGLEVAYRVARAGVASSLALRPHGRLASAGPHGSLVCHASQVMSQQRLRLASAACSPRPRAAARCACRCHALHGYPRWVALSGGVRQNEARESLHRGPRGARATVHDRAPP